MAPQSTRWCFTLNNYSDAEVEVLRALAPTVKYIVFGREIAPDTLTPHLQGFVIFFSPIRLNACKLAVSNRAHLEVARGTSDQAATYCKKEDAFEEFGSVPVAGKTNRYDDFKQWVLEQPTKPTTYNVANTFPSLYLQNGRIMEFVDIIYPALNVVEGELRPYQQHLVDRLALPPCDRKIIFVVDERGNTGKTWFTKKYMSLFPDSVQQLSVGKRDDIAFAINESKRVFFFDLPRSSAEFLQYTVLEQLKNQAVMSNKYQSRNKVLEHIPHVVVFMNERPDMNKLSSDRYEIINWRTI